MKVVIYVLQLGALTRQDQALVQPVVVKEKLDQHKAFFLLGALAQLVVVKAHPLKTHV